MSRSRAVLVATGAALTLGCYAYVPAKLDFVPVGDDFRALLLTDAELAL